MDRLTRHDAMRRVAVALVLTAGLVLARSAPAHASDAPTAAALIHKLIEEDVCEESLRAVSVGRHEMDCRTDLHGGSLIRVRAYSAPRSLERSIRRAVAALCASLAQPADAAAEHPVVLVVGPTWYVHATPVHNREIARRLGGEVTSYACS
ncbi:MAG TPA: hypothetical protein VIH82_04655 [Acidimicrobiia bacterium]